jgi:hypothetical protein
MQFAISASAPTIVASSGSTLTVVALVAVSLLANLPEANGQASDTGFVAALKSHIGARRHGRWITRRWSISAPTCSSIPRYRPRERRLASPVICRISDGESLKQRVATIPASSPRAGRRRCSGSAMPMRRARDNHADGGRQDGWQASPCRPASSNRPVTIDQHVTASTAHWTRLRNHRANVSGQLADNQGVIHDQAHHNEFSCCDDCRRSDGGRRRRQRRPDSGPGPSGSGSRPQNQPGVHAGRCRCPAPSFSKCERRKTPSNGPAGAASLIPPSGTMPSETMRLTGWTLRRADHGG